MKKLILLFALLGAISGAYAQTIIASGDCGANGNNVTWTLTDSGVLTVSGSGAMADYTYNFNVAPWYPNVSQIKTVIIGSGVTAIGNRAFAQCGVLTSITIPDKVTTIGKQAFAACIGLTSMTIPANVTTIGAGIFNFCNSLTSISVNTSNPNFSSLDGVLYNKDQSTLLCCPAGKTGTFTILNKVTAIGEQAFSSCARLTSISIPNSVATIGEEAFGYCKGLTSITVPENITRIERNTFCDCYNLTSVTIPASVTTIEEQAFYGCSGLTSVTIPNSVTSIGSSAFSDCTGLTSVSIGNSVTSIGISAFGGCTGLTSIICKAIIPPSTAPLVFRSVDKSIPVSVYCSLVEAYQAAAGWKDFTDYGNCLAVTVVASGDCGTEGSNVTWTLTDSGVLTVSGSGAMAGYGFDDNPWYEHRSQIKTGIIETGVTTIGAGAFTGCTGLISITIPNSITTIEDYAFYGCTGLTSVSIPNSVTTIRDWTFNGCTDLTSITIPASVKTIEEGVFANCNSLTSINVNADNPNYSSLDGVLYNKDQSTLLCCPAGKTGTFIIPGSVTTIGLHAFFACKGLTSVSIPNSVTTIRGQAFAGCTGLTSITIPASVKTIEWGTFGWCTGLTSIICKAIVPPIVGSNTFENVDKSIPVSVPCGSVEAYRAAAGWNEFTDYSDCLDISGICEPEQANALIVYPNPVKDELRVESGVSTALNNQEWRVENVEILDLSGKTLFLPSCGGVGGGFSINVSHLPAGIYLVKIKTDKGNVTGKFVKE